MGEGWAEQWNRMIYRGGKAEIFQEGAGGAGGKEELLLVYGLGRRGGGMALYGRLNQFQWCFASEINTLTRSSTMNKKHKITSYFEHIYYICHDDSS